MRGTVLLLGDTGKVGTAVKAAMGPRTTVIGANFVNAIRGAFNRTSIHRSQPPFFDPVDLGVKNFYSYRDNETVMAVTGGFNISLLPNLMIRPEGRYQWGPGQTESANNPAGLPVNVGLFGVDVILKF